MVYLSALSCRDLKLNCRVSSIHMHMKGSPWFWRSSMNIFSGVGFSAEGVMPEVKAITLLAEITWTFSILEIKFVVWNSNYSCDTDTSESYTGTASRLGTALYRHSSPPCSWAFLNLDCTDAELGHRCVDRAEALCKAKELPENPHPGIKFSEEQFNSFSLASKLPSAVCLRRKCWEFRLGDAE